MDSTTTLFLMSNVAPSIVSPCIAHALARGRRHGREVLHVRDLRHVDHLVERPELRRLECFRATSCWAAVMNPAGLEKPWISTTAGGRWPATCAAARR